jgi:hypothetical protein
VRQCDCFLIARCYVIGVAWPVLKREFCRPDKISVINN